MGSDKWNWRSRAHDPRYAGWLIAGLCIAAGFLILLRSDLTGALIGGVIAFAVFAVVGLIALPPWRDPNHSERAGGYVLAVGGVVILALVLIVGLGFGLTLN